MKKITRSKINRRILKSLRKVSFVLTILFLAISFGKIQGTNSFFTDTATSSGNTMTAGYWIPELEMTVDPADPDGEDGFYETTPCVTLSANINGETSGITIYYEFSDDGNPIDGGTIYSGACVPIPDGDPTPFQAQAVNDENPDWKSAVIEREFKVDTSAACPVVEITKPADGEKVSGTVEIRGSVEDTDPHRYWLVVENSSGTKVAGPGTVNENSSFTDDFLMNWNTTAKPDGEYTIKLEARDAAGNKCPDQSPVSEDPEEDDDSVDWITVEVKNEYEAKAGDVVINEVMWMGSQKDDGTRYSADEWIELRNMTSRDIKIKNWNIFGAVSGSGGHLEIAANPLDDFVIPAHGYFMIANYNKSNSLIDEDVDLVKTSINFNDKYDESGQIILKDTLGNIIDSAPMPANEDWPAGKKESDKKWSMERNLDPEDGTDDDSWHTCDRGIMSESDLATMKGYWDSNAQNYNCGTPGHSNLSKNDPSAEDFDPAALEHKILDEEDTSPTGEVSVAGENNLPVDIPSEVPAVDNTIQQSSDIVTEEQGNNIPADEVAGGETESADGLDAAPETPPADIPADTSDRDDTNDSDNITERSADNVIEESSSTAPEITPESTETVKGGTTGEVMETPTEEPEESSADEIKKDSAEEEAAAVETEKPETEKEEEVKTEESKEEEPKKEESKEEAEPAETETTE